nr:MAG TPA: hypothetical protein [Bacteriophage sp.]
MKAINYGYSVVMIFNFTTTNLSSGISPRSLEINLTKRVTEIFCI